MIYFITNRTHNVVPNETIKVENNLDRVQLYLELIESEGRNILAYDLETTGLDYFKDDVILLGIGDHKTQFCIDISSIDINPVKENIQSKTILGHNLKFDYQFSQSKLGVTFYRVYDTMIAEQRLYQNLGLENALDKVIARNIGIIPKNYGKEIRKEFQGKNTKTFKLENRHIEYLACDIEYLPEIQKIQRTKIAKWNMDFLLTEIEFPLVIVLAECEMYGSILDTDKVKELDKKCKEEKFQFEKDLDEIVRSMRDGEDLNLIGGKFDRERKEKEKICQIDIFGEKEEIKQVNNDAYINYNSVTQLLKLAASLKIEIPTEKGNKGIPIIDIDNKIIPRLEDKWTTGEKAIDKFLIENPKSSSKEFFKKLIDYREVQTNISRYGLSFIESINPITNRIHTIFRQATADNGRLQSGGGKENPYKFNCQNVPRKKEYREIFLAPEGYLRMTIDLIGGEVTILASKAEDEELFKLAMQGKIHQIVATEGWRAIWKSRGDKEKAETYIVSKEKDLEEYTMCKNLTFGNIYGCGAVKAGKTIGVSTREGQIYQNTHKRKFPKTFKLVEKNVELAMGKYDNRGNQLSWGKGYLILNERTNSRIWFRNVIESIKNRRSLSFKEQYEVDGQARNIPISGTQADMLKEAMVRIYKHFKSIDKEIHLVWSVHDEIVMDFKEEDKNWIPETVKKILIDTCNKYLTDKIQMDADYSIGKSWQK